MLAQQYLQYNYINVKNTQPHIGLCLSKTLHLHPSSTKFFY